MGEKTGFPEYGTWRAQPCTAIDIADAGGVKAIRSELTRMCKNTCETEKGVLEDEAKEM